jgi:hypothetical protein
MESKGFIHVRNGVDLGAYYTYAGDMMTQAVYDLAMEAARKTGKQFIIFISNSAGSPGTGMVC